MCDKRHRKIFSGPIRIRQPETYHTPSSLPYSAYQYTDLPPPPPVDDITGQTTTPLPRIPPRPYLHERLLAEFLVDLGTVGDVFGALGVVERTERLLEVAGGRRHRGDDGRLGAPAQRVLQQPRQLRLSAQGQRRRRDGQADRGGQWCSVENKPFIARTGG